MNKNNHLLWKYAGMATQFLVSIGIGVFIGLKIDQWLKFKVPIAAWVLPLLIIIGIIIVIMKDTAPKK
ncbi:MAG TPA: hypothetical protein VK498_02385 [Ferruginibacter sp.]|nr:hypothetical protein [Ferruginibacter sp.]